MSVTDAQRAVLEGWLRRRSTAQALAQRSRIVLECAEGHSIMEVSRRLLADWNEHPRPFVWTKTADEILDKVAAYCRQISDSGH
ncbi:hypothetical protein [Streptomyces tendae]|uniref:hypothetical protein n=1 Tax=Streptomyces tendae TaxID=1932 RepID=UPI00342399AF